MQQRSTARIATLAAALMLAVSPMATVAAAQDDSAATRDDAAAMRGASAAVPSDSSTTRHAHGAPFLDRRDLVTLVAAGALSAGLSAFDLRMARWWNAPAQQNNSTYRSLSNSFTHVQETTLTLGAASLYLIGRLAHQREFSDVMFHTTASIVTASIVSQAIRGPLGRKRPIETNFGDAYDFNFMGGFTSFANRAYPSLHAASNFAAATALVAETHRRSPKATWIVAPVAYTLATIPPVSRMYLGRHWGSDVVMGAAIGVMSGLKVVGYSHTHAPTPVDRFFLGLQDHVAITPGAEGTARIGYMRSF